MRHLLAILVVLLITSCGSNQAPPVSDDAIQTAIANTQAAYTDTPEPTGTPTASPTAAATATETNTSTPTPEPFSLSDDQMSDLMLTVADLESGFTVDSARTGRMDEVLFVDIRGQSYVDFIKEDSQFKGFEAAFSRGSLGTAAYMRSWVFEFPSDARASEFLEVYGDLTSGDIDSSPMSFSHYPEESAAYLGHIIENGKVTTDVLEILIRRNNIVVGLTVSTFPNLVVISEIEGYTSILAERLSEVLSEN